MEASGAGLAGAASGDGGEQASEGQQQAQGQQGAQGAPAAGEQAQQQPQGEQAIAQMAQQLEGLQGSQEEIRAFLEQNLQQAAEPAGAEGEQPSDDLDLGFLETETDPQRAQQQLQEQIDRRVEARAQALMQDELGPLRAEVGDMRIESETREILKEFPDLGKQDVAAQVIEAARLQAEQFGHPELVANPQFVRAVYIQGRAMEMAQQQDGAAAAPGAATLEGAGGASPGGAGQGAADPAEAIRESWSGNRDVLAQL